MFQTAVAVWLTAVAAMAECLLCETTDMPHRGQYELTWMENPPTRQSPNPNGITAWVVIKRSTNAVYGPGKSLKVHICAHNPCLVKWKAERYGPAGPVVHMQRITCMGPAAAPVLVWTAAPIADPSAIKTAVAVSTHPTSAAHQTTVAHNHAAQGIRDQILALAREIRKPRAWIGYIA